VAAVSRLEYLFLANFSKPASDRPLYAAIRKARPQRIVSLGVAMGQRCLRMIGVAQRFAEASPVEFTGIDLFEARPSTAPGMTLKRAHRELGKTGARVRLAPGEPALALARVANSLVGTDLVLIAADQDRDSLATAWYYLPRMVHEGSLVFEETETAGRASLNLVRADEIARRAAAARGDSAGRAA